MSSERAANGGSIGRKLMKNYLPEFEIHYGSVAYRGGFGGSNPPKFQNFDKA
jgi:hypothetical protein